MKISPRLAITLTFIAFGVMVGSQVGSIPVLKDQSNIDKLTFGILSGVATAANILAMGLGGWVNRHFDHRGVLLFILPSACGVLALSLSSHSVLAYGLTFFIFNFCLGTLDLFMNAEAAIVEHDAKRPIFASFHAAVLYAIGLSGLLGSYIAVNFGTLWATLPSLPFLAAAVWAVNGAIPHRPPEANKSMAKVQLPTKILTLIGIIIGFDVAAELACVSWAGQLLAEKQPALAAWSGLGVAFYGLCNGSVRLMGDALRARYSDITLVIISFCVGVVGFAILATNPGFEISVIAFAIAGCGLGLIFPCLFSVAANLAPNTRAAALGHASAVSGPPRIFIPVLLGWIAQSFGLSSIYVVAVIASVVAIGVAVWAGREIAKRKGAQVALRPNATN